MKLQQNQAEAKLILLPDKGAASGGLLLLLDDVFSTVKDLQHQVHSLAHANVQVGLVAFDVVVQVVAEQLEVTDGQIAVLSDVVTSFEDYRREQSANRTRT
jgi:hypothetical protein